MIDVDQLLDEVAADVGLADYGDPSFRQGLESLVVALPGARLNDIGVAAADTTIRQSLTNRLRVTEWHARHPALADQEPEVALIVVGLPRTGTTALSHLLGADRANRSLRGWEANESVPPPTTEHYWHDPRYLAAKEAGNLLHLLNPEFKAIHHDEPDEPVECSMTLAQHFASITLNTTFNLDQAYTKWLLDTDLTAAYDWHRQVLQVLGSQCPGPWQLKSPVHGYAMEEVAAAYPQALFVQTHRDPARCIASTLSLTESLSSSFTDHDFHDQIAREWPETLARVLDGILDYRQAHGDHRFLDLAYGDLVADPMGCVHQVYERLGRAPTPESEAEMANHMAEAVQGRYGTHSYSLAEFGLERGPLDERLSRYWDRFDVPRENA